MNKKDLDFLKALTEAPSPSGFEAPVARILRERLEPYADKIETNVLGSVHATLLGKGNGPSIMIAGHIDEIGLMTTYISDEGFISFQAIGGIDAAILPGLRVNIWATGEDAKPGQALCGVLGRKPIHLMEQDDRKTVTKIDQLYIDAGMESKKLKTLVRIGDAITFAVGFEELGDGYAVGRAFDDKLGVWIAARVLEEVKKAGGASGDVIAAGTVQEEIGLRGGTTSAYELNPSIGISVEVGHATDYPDISKRKIGQANCGKGPLIARGPNINPVLFERMVAAAKKSKTAYQIAPESRATGTDANAIQLSRGGKVAGLISIPLRYMHTPSEVVKLSDIEATVKILTRFILDLDEKVDFVPR